MAKIALLVGVSDYQPESGLPALPNAANDPQAMKRVLEAAEIGGFDEARLLLNPARQELEMAIYELFVNRAADDVLLFYFSGHGVLDQNYNLYLTVPKTQKDRAGAVIPPTAVAASYLQAQMNNTLSERVATVLDCCFSGKFGEGLTAKDGGSLDLEQFLGGPGRAILTSSNSTQYSFQQKNAELSIYTQFLVEGLETGAADRDQDGWISADELHRYASEKVCEQAPAMTPQFFPVRDGHRIKLARAPQDDPELGYRREVERIVAEDAEDAEDIDFLAGEFGFLSRVYLDEHRERLGVPAELAREIELAVLKPHRQRQQKLQDYEQLLAQAVEQRYPLKANDQRRLQEIQQIWGLRDEDVTPIVAKLTPQTATPKTPATETKPARLTFSFKTVRVDERGRIVEERDGTAEYFDEDLGKGVKLRMVAIPGGQFRMGSPKNEAQRWDSEGPQHEVRVSPFCLGEFPVTQAQWRAVAQQGAKVERGLKPEPSNFSGSDELRVEQVSWDDAVEFCARLSKLTGKDYRLPNEAEWEYACRAGTTTPFHFGPTITPDLANYRGNVTYASGPKGVYREKTTPRGTFKFANAFGLLDMHGNVWEWCADPWHDNYQGAPDKAVIWSSSDESETRRVLRGGSWSSNPWNCRSANRGRSNRDNRSHVIGFRVACGAARTLPSSL